VTLADPTGAIRCTIHKDALAEEPWAMRKGGALLLKVGRCWLTPG